MGFTFNGGQPDITFSRDTPRGKGFLLSLQQRATTAKTLGTGLHGAWPGVMGERWDVLTQLAQNPRNVPVPLWAVYGPPTSRPLAPLRAKQYSNYTTLGLWQQLQKRP